MSHQEHATLFPKELINDWSNRLQRSECSVPLCNQMTLLIKHTLPHPSVESVQECLAGLATVFGTVGNTNLDKASVLEALKKLDEAGQLDAVAHFGLSHPLAAAIRKIRKAAADHQIDPSQWLAWFLELCGQAQKHPEHLTRSCYYRHTVYARDVVIFIMLNHATGALLSDQSVNQACIQLNDWFQREAKTGAPIPIPVTGVKNLEEKTDVVTHLIEGVWQFGVPSVVRKRQGKTDESDGDVLPPDKMLTQAIPLPRILTPTTEALKAAQPAKKQPRNQSLSYSLGEANDAPSQLITQPAPSSDPAEPESRVDGNAVETAHFSAPPEFSTSERRHHYASLLNVQAAHNVASRSDMQRYSRRQLSTWLEQFAEEDSLTAVFLLLVWSLGMAPERLSSLRVGTNSLSDNEDVVLDPVSQQLTYRVLNLGATPDTHNTHAPNQLPANHLMRLTVPASLVQRIVASSQEQPFRDMETQYKTLRKTLRKRHGRSPCTLKLWAASAPACHAERMNILEAATLRGSLNFNEVASSAYRRHDRAVLNAKFSDCLNGLRAYWDAEGLMGGAGTEPFADFTITDAYPDGALGSIRYAAPDALARVVYVIRNRIKQTKQRLNSPYQTKSLGELLGLINLQQLHYFLVVQLHTLGRALNNKTTVGFSAEGLWVSDKASHRYRERKLICAISPQDMAKQRGLFLGQRRECRDALDQLTELARTLGLAVELGEPAVAELPCFVEMNRGQNQLTVNRLTPGRWQRAIDELGLSETWTMAGNAFRHLASTELSTSLSDALVDEVLGHKHPGRDWWGSESAGTFEELTVMTTIIEKWANQLGLKAVNIDQVAFRGFYVISQ
jgi:hypothetical protein